MSDVSSDEELEPVNVFQQARTGKMKRSSLGPRSPGRSPMATRSPFRKTRRLGDPSENQAKILDPAAVVIPPLDWPRPARSSGGDAVFGSPPHENGTEPADPYKNDGQPTGSPSFSSTSDREQSPNVPALNRGLLAPHEAPSEALVVSPSKEHRDVSRPVRSPFESSSRATSLDHTDVIEELMMPSSEGLDPDQFDAIVQQLSAGTQTTSSIDTLPLERFATAEGLVLEPVEPLAHPGSIEVAGKLSRIEKVDVEVFAAAINHLHNKMGQESRALEMLRETPVDRNAKLAVPVQSLWDSAELRGEFSRLRAEFRRLRDLRMQLMQQLNDLKHEQSQAYTSAKVYAQLHAQIREAEALIDEYAASAAKADEMVRGIKELERNLESQLDEYRAAEAQRRDQISSIQTAVLAGADAAGNDEGASHPSEELGLNTVRRRVSHLAKSLDVTIRTDDASGLVITLFMAIRIDLDTGYKEFAWSYPPICREVFDHYRALVEGKPRRSVRELLGLWRRGLAVHDAFVALLGRGFFARTEVNAELDTTTFELFDIRHRRPLRLHLQGELVVSEEDLPELQGLNVESKIGNE